MMNLIRQKLPSQILSTLFKFNNPVSFPQVSILVAKTINFQPTKRHYRASENFVNDQKFFEKSANSENLSVIRVAERNKLRIQRMPPIDREIYFKSLLDNILKEKPLYAGFIARYIELKNEFCIDSDFSKMMSMLKENNLHPDCKFFAAFIRNSCRKGDMDETSNYLKIMHQMGVMPNEFIFANILHGYIKCGLPDEIAATQDVMSNLNFWPSKLAAEYMLSAYADLGDGAGLMETMKESQLQLHSNEGEVVFSNRLLAELYSRLAVAPNFSSNQIAADYLLNILKKRDPRGEDFSLGFPLYNLLSSGHTEAALNMITALKPHNLSPRFIGNIADSIVHDERDIATLRKFWEASGDINRLADLSIFMSTENLLLTLKCCPIEQVETLWRLTSFTVMRAFRKNNINDIMEIGKVVYEKKEFLYYMIVVPRLLLLGMKPEEIISACKDQNKKSASALGCVLSELCTIPTLKQFAQPADQEKMRNGSLESAQNILDQFTSSGALPFRGFISLNPRIMRTMLTGALRHSSNGDISSDKSSIEVSKEKLLVWADALFSCFPEDRHSLLAEGITKQLHRSIEDNSQSTQDRPSTPLIKAGQTLSDALSSYLSKKTSSNLDWRTSRSSDFQTGSFSSTSAFDKISAAIRSGNIEAALKSIEEITNSGVDENLRLGTVIRRGKDLLDEAFEVASRTDASPGGTEAADLSGAITSAAAPSYSSQQLEKLFWILSQANFLRSLRSSVSKLANHYLTSSDVDGLITFLNKLVETTPGCLSQVLSINLITSMLQLNDNGTQNFLKTVCANETVSLPSMVYILYNLQTALQSRSEQSEPSLDIGVSMLSTRLEGLTHMRKVRAVHDAVENLCHGRRILPAYALRDWAVKLGMVLLVQTSEVLISSSVFMEDISPIPESILNVQRLALHKNPDVSFVSKIYEMKNWSSDRLDQTINSIAQILCENPVIAESTDSADSRSKTTRFMLFSLLSQALGNPNSPLSTDNAWRRLATQLINADASIGADACLFWMSCLLNRNKINSIMLAGLASEKSNLKFIEHLKKCPLLPHEMAVSPLFDDLDSCQKESVLNSFDASGDLNLVKLAHALKKWNNIQPQAAMEELKTDLNSSLVNLINADFSILTPVIEALDTSPLDEKISLLNRVLEATQIRKVPAEDIFHVLNTMALPDLMAGEKNWLSLKNRLSDGNQVYLHALFKFLQFSRNYSHGWSSTAKLLQNINFRDDMSSTKILQAMRYNNHTILADALLRINESDPSNLQRSCNSIIHSYVLENLTPNLSPLLFSVCNLRNGDLLEAISRPASPFLFNNFAGSFTGLADVFRHRSLDQVTTESINFHKLNKYCVAPAKSHSVGPITSLSMKSSTLVEGDSFEPMKLAKESISVLVSKLSGDQLSDDESKSLVEMVRKLWGPGRVDIVLCHLVEMNNLKAVDRIVDNMSDELKDRRLPFKALTRILCHHAQPSNSDPSQYASALSSLRACESQHLTLCMTGPHISSLFSTWPVEALTDAIELVELTSGRVQTILKLQLAASLVHRNLLDKAAPLLKDAGPLPFNYLAGTLQHPLDRSSLLASVDYIRKSDESHLTSLLDASLRNAAISARNKNAFTASELVKTAVNDLGMDLKSACQPTTLRLLHEIAKDDPKLFELLPSS